MLTHPTLHKIQELKLYGMSKEFEEQTSSEKSQELSFQERLGLMVDREIVYREDKRFTSRLREAKLRLPATIEDIDFKPLRGLDRSLILSLASCDWIKKNQNLLITGATGSGKTYLTCAFGHQACRKGFRVRYYRTTNMFEELGVGKGDGRYAKMMARIARQDLLIIDDWGLQGFSETQRRDLFDILEDRHGLKSTIIASQFPVDMWHKTLDSPTLADAILDRLIHNATIINVKGESMRKIKKTNSTE